MLGYRTVFEVQQGREDILELVLQQQHSWLRSKGYDSDELETGVPLKPADHVELLALERSTQDGSRAFRAKLDEDNSTGVWTSQLTVLVPGSADPALVWLDISNPEVHRADGEQPLRRRKWTGTPRLARNLISVLSAYDGSARLDTRPRVIHGDEAHGLIDTLHGDERRGPIYVAGTEPQMPLQPWVELVAGLLRDTVGLGAAYVLDAEATEIFSARAGDGHAVRPGTLRTFLPHVRFDDPDDGIKHRVLNTERINREAESHLRRLLGWRARDVTIEGRLPTVLTRLDRYFEEQTDLILVGGVSGSSGGAHAEEGTEPDPVAVRYEDAAASVRDGEIAVLLREELGTDEVTRDGVRELLGRVRLGEAERIDRAAVTKRLETLQVRNAELQLSLDNTVEQLEDEELEHALTFQEFERADSRARHFQTLLIHGQRHEEAWSEPDAEETPDSFDDVLAWFERLTHVTFTGDAGRTRELSAHDPVGVWARKTWLTVLALEDYGRATLEGRCPRNVEGYLRHPPEGCRVHSANRHARDESDDVRSNTKLHAARVFPVPTGVDPREQVFMGAHFKIAQYGMISPRLHYLDDTAGSGTVYVGYIGPHLPTKQTN